MSQPQASFECFLPRFKPGLSDAIARLGNLGLLQRTRADGCELNKLTCRAAGEGGHLDAIEWATANGCPWNDTLLVAAAEAVLQWARSEDSWWSLEPYDAAASGGHLYVLRWLRDMGYHWNKVTCAAAAGAGLLDVHPPVAASQRVSVGLASVRLRHKRRGHLDVLRWLRDNWCPWDSQTCESATCGGHLAVLRWGREDGCPWDPYTCEDGAALGHLDILRGARRQECRWDGHNTVRAARQRELTDVAEWAVANVCPAELGLLE